MNSMYSVDGVIFLTNCEDVKHDILLIITVSIFIFCIVGIGISDAPVPPVTIIP